MDENDDLRHCFYLKGFYAIDFDAAGLYRKKAIFYRGIPEKRQADVRLRNTSSNDWLSLCSDTIFKFCSTVS